MKRAKILSASAGSGKTYQLALKYMCDIIEHPERYRNILAVTFTNKATEEMKSRILREIHVLASGGQSIYLESIKDLLGISEDKVREGALKARTRILHDYSRFTILTIDRFFQRILRAFIKELSLELNYNIEIDATQLLERGADTLVESITTNEEVRKWLLEFAEERLIEGTRWDMRSDLCRLGSELFKENGAKRMNSNLNKQGLRDIVNQLIDTSDGYKQEIKDLGQRGVDIMREYNVKYDQFKGASTSFVRHFAIYASGELKSPTQTMLKAAENIKEWYKAGTDGNVVLAAEKLQPILQDICSLYSKATKQINTAKLIRDNYRSFALLADMQQNISDICKRENIMILSNTKDRLSEFVDDYNAPFIYEKVGNRYDHYMIDEFQDTSVREWRNMLPLLKEALASNPNSSVFIVGDIKQSIYRWRGGDWRLLNDIAADNLGRENVEVGHLKMNYRSLGNIVSFNNRLIDSVVSTDNHYLNREIDEALSRKKISHDTHSSLHDIMLHAYDEHAQSVKPEKENLGYVEVSLYDSQTCDSPFIEAIESAIARSYRYRDILILVRGFNDARKVADALFSYKERVFTSRGLAGFNILTPDSLTLEGNEVVEFIISVLRLAMNSSNDVERGVYNRFMRYNINRTFSPEETTLLRTIANLSPMEAFEEIVSHFELHKHKESIAFIQAMHEQIVSFTTTRLADIQHYLEWWDERGKNEPVVVEMSDDTIEITTIHKAKGLERDIVIIPYARWDMTPRASLQPIVWAKAEGEDGAAEIGDFPVIYGSTMENSAFAEEYYKELVMCHIDGVNLLYVAITRASKELYMYVPYLLNSNSKGSDTITTTTPLILGAAKSICPTPEVIKEDEHIVRTTYAYGNKTEQSGKEREDSSKSNTLLDCYTTNKPSVKVHYPTKRLAEEGAIECGLSLRQGVLLHGIFECADTVEDLYGTISRRVAEGVIDSDEAKSITRYIEHAMQHDLAKEWFDGSWDDIKREADIILQGTIKRPDRVMIKGRKAVIVDYKFGNKRYDGYTKQVSNYMELLRQMGRFDDIEGYVWYIMLGEIERV